jgi:hypothetical protein
MDDETKKKLAELEAKIAKLEAKMKKNDEDFVHYIEQHGQHHHEVDKLAYWAYFKTHPEYCKSMNQYHEIVDAKSKRPDKPKQ